MLPGKVYSAEDVLRIVRQRFWYVLLPLAVISAGTALWARRLPDMYQSEASIQVEPQRVPDSYVRSTVTTRLEDRLPSMQAQIMSRTRLEAIINEFNLYEGARQQFPMEDIVQRMRVYDIESQVVRGDAFRISYRGTNPRVVQQVTERLASLFIDENTQDRVRAAENTSAFIEAQLDDAKRRLVETEKKLESYKLRHAGQLPTNLESNLSVLRNAQTQLQSVMQTLRDEGDRRARLERDIAALEQEVADIPAAAGTGAAGSSPAVQLEAMKEQLASLLRTKKDTHPEVKILRASIASLEQQLTSTPRQPSDMQVDLRTLSPSEATRRRRLDEMKIELNRVKRDIEVAQREQERLKRDIQNYQARNEAIPIRETEMTELVRDYTTMNATYLRLLQNKEDSRIAANLENRQIGEQFRILDPARVAETPFSPDRSRYNAIGAAAGLSLGMLLVGFLEFRDKSFRRDDEIARLLTLPVLAIVPLMQSPAEQKRVLRNRVLMHAGLAATVVVCAAVVAYTIVR
jgi:polysaccharide chain length determinant protein (PEP-CTERM system associated)